ncbi:FkbM family methyltransferase [Hyphobacterium sp. HN65]|uniref:FkbM family methyltransferase n=1 Tax=Hyphobacterium lacteum TaxID=3116575 RepID=A0ABU7LTM0_9PROT|nr:FkbM family methyltransferase [Hyphobacterium sp. HN65]MEE2527241.1 FkbM family methyltransferase [Hyphobacterium sp. HN65]
MENTADIPWGALAPSGLFKASVERARKSDSKVWARIASWLAPDTVDIETLGFRARLHPKDNLSEKRILYNPGRFDPAELACLSAKMGAGFVFVDLGANCGTYTFHLASQADASARFYAIEAQPEMARRFRFNHMANDFAASIQLDELAISDVAGEITFTVNRHNRGESGLEGDGEQIRVPAISLKDYLADRQLSHVDAMKIDIEGQEHRILKPFFEQTPHECWPDCLIVEQLLATPEKDPVQLALQHGYQVEQDLTRNVILRKRKTG